MIKNIKPVRNGINAYRRHLGYIFHSVTNTQPEWLACGSWEFKTRETRAFVRISIRSRRRDKRELEETKQYFMNLLQKSSEVATHPLSILVTLWEQGVKHVSASEINLGLKMDELEMETGQSPFLTADESQQATNLAILSNALNKHSASTALQEKNAHVTRKSLLDLRDGLVRLGQMQCSLECNSNLLLDQTDVLLNALEHKTHNLQGLQKRCQVQLSYASNLQAKYPTLIWLISLIGL